MASSKLRTFKKWNKKGFYVLKGSKALGFKEGQPLFSKKQVRKKISYSNREGSYGLSYEGNDRQNWNEYECAMEDTLQEMYDGSGR